MGLWRFAIAFFAIVGTYRGWLQPNLWVYFTYQSNIVLAFIMLWAGAATMLRGIQPPAWIKGGITVYITVTALVAYFMLAPADPATTPHVFGIMTTTMLHQIAPIMAFIDFVLADVHRRYAWHFALSWLAYPLAYLAFVLARARMFPLSGPADGGNPYPYPFIDVPRLTLTQFGFNIGKLFIVVLGVGLIVLLLDRLLPKQEILR